MNNVVQVFRAVASELARRANESMPKLREDEKLRREWFKDGVYCRETVLNGNIFLARYDFKKMEVFV